MSKQLEQIISGLTQKQRDAALERKRDVMVKAGAGSGKTRTLVARYVSLLDDGLLPSQIAAITFTEKAAREMKTRVRAQIKQLADSAGESSENQWIDRLNAMDSARIGTIHSLCSQILRAHPAEAGIDPDFSVLDEGQTAILISDIVESVIAQTADKEEYSTLYKFFPTEAVSSVFTALLQNRMDAEEYLSITTNEEVFIRERVLLFLDLPIVKDFVDHCSEISEERLNAEAGDVVAEKAMLLTQTCRQLRTEAEAGLNGYKCFEMLENVFSGWDARSGKRTPWKSDLSAIKKKEDTFFEFMNSKKANLCNENQEHEYDQMIDCCRKLFPQMVSLFKAALAANRALDFDGLEENALAVLQIPSVQQKWSQMIQAVLVDEFQDTNARQTRLIHLLADRPGKLFVVGDEKQSIYRFRRADVSVFSQTAKEIQRQGGLMINLDETYRSHRPLMDGMGCLLQNGMTLSELEGRSFYVPYTALISNCETPPGVKEPYIECLIGKCEKKEGSVNSSANKNSRIAAVQLLIERLRELKKVGEISDWNDVVLLFRSSSGFHYYEDEFEKVGIPYVTVAGKGFYDRPEIRDVLNMLRAFANPMDNNALAGFLLSPVIGFSMDMLASLRNFHDEDENKPPLWQVLQSDIQMPDGNQQKLKDRAVQILLELTSAAGRITVDELLEKLYALTDYRNVLAMESSERLWRNLDKLQRDARLSGKTVVAEFLEYINNINVVGAREGEAPSDREGAVRLMTIHKAKGLEFPIVVLADAGYKGNAPAPDILLSETLGLCLKSDPVSIKYACAKLADSEKDQAELARLFYVAATRAKNRLIINGASGGSKSDFLHKATDAIRTEENTPETHLAFTAANNPILYKIKDQVDSTYEILPSEKSSESENWTGCSLLPALEMKKESIPVAERADAEISFGLTVGRLVHKALELWIFPDDAELRPMLEKMLISQTDLSEELRSKALERTVTLLRRFQKSSLYAEIMNADVQMHEVPYSIPMKNFTVNGIIDLIMRKGQKWLVIDFKTDAIHNQEEFALLVPKYQKQISHYTQAVNNLLNTAAERVLCFLDYYDEVHLIRDEGKNETDSEKKDGWADALYYLEETDSPLFSFAQELQIRKVPAPECCYELVTSDNEIAEMAWPDQKIAVLLNDSIESGISAYKKAGWQVFLPDQLDELRKKFNSLDQNRKG